MKRIANITAVLLMLAGTASIASADRFHDGYGRRGPSGANFGLQIGNVGLSFGNSPRFSSSRFSYRQPKQHGVNRGISYGGGGFGRVRHHVPATWHHTSHYDYQAPSVVRHGNHYDYTPGHYDRYRTGYWESCHGSYH